MMQTTDLTWSVQVKQIHSSQWLLWREAISYQDAKADYSDLLVNPNMQAVRLVHGTEILRESLCLAVSL